MPSSDPHRVVSISLPESMLREADALVAAGRATGRSHLVRDALARYVAEEKARGGGEGPVGVVVAACFDRAQERRVADVKHEHASLLKGMLHNHLADDDCLEVYILRGRGKETDGFLKALGNIRGLHVIRVMEVPEHASA